MSNAKQDKDIVRRKLVIVGDGACGKTSLLSVFTLGYFPKVNPSSSSSYPFDTLPPPPPLLLLPATRESSNQMTKRQPDHPLSLCIFMYIEKKTQRHHFWTRETETQHTLHGSIHSSHMVPWGTWMKELTLWTCGPCHGTWHSYEERIK